MFRRSRFSVRPNVGTAGRTAATPQESPAAKQETGGTAKEASEGSRVPDESNAPPLEKNPASGDGVDHNGDGSNSSAALQRRKRFSIKPKVAPGRPSAPPRTPKSPIKAASAPLSETPSSEMEKPSTSSQAGTTTAPNRLLSPRTRRHSDNSKQHKPQPKLTPPPSETPAVSVAEDSPEQTPPAADGSKKPESTSRSHPKEVAPRVPDKVPPSLPDKAATEISEKARALVSSKTAGSLPSSALYLSRLLNSPLDVQRLVKAQKLRELLRRERSKEKSIKRAKARCKEFDLDPTKMTMRDLIHYLPTSNPMTSVLDDSVEENETEVPPAVERQEPPERAQEPPAPPPMKVVSSEEEGAACEEEEEQEEEIMVPQVKVAEDGSLIIDEESLTVEVLRSKGPNTIQDRDPIFERGSTTTYSSFRKGTYTKPWSIEETDMFYLAISMVGTDFSMICQLFTHRARSEIKNKFKREERENSWRIDKAFRERRKLDIEYFSKLLEKVLEVQRDRKKLKKISENTSGKCKKKPKRKQSAKKLSDVEEEEEEEEEEEFLMPELEGEKENEDQSNEGEAAAVKSGRKRKKKNQAEALIEEPSDKKNKTDEAGVPEDSEAALPEELPAADTAEKTENVKTAKDAAIKPAKLCRGRAPNPLVPLGLKRGKKPLPSAKAKGTEEDNREETGREGADQEQGESENEAQLSQERKRKDEGDVSSEGEEDAAVKPQRPTRYGRVPKPVQPLMYAAKDDLHSPTSSDTSKGPAKRGKSVEPPPVQKSKKPKLVTLRSSRSEFSDEENENEWEEEEHHLTRSSSRDGDAHGFVQSSLHASNTEISEVDDTMVELDILDSMPDVLGLSQDALCPDSTCQQADHDTGTPEPSEHQLDLLVDVIDFISSEQAEVSQDESYTEAAQTLLTIGNRAQISQSAQSGETLEECAAGTSVGVSDFTYAQEEILTVSPQKRIPSGKSADQKVTSPSTEKLQSAEVDSNNSLPVETSDQNVDQLGCKSREKSTLIKAGLCSKVKPKPNLGHSSRTAKLVSHTEMSTEGGAGRSCSVSQCVSQDNETSVSAEETTPGISASAAALFKDNTSSQRGCLDQVETGAADQNLLKSQSQTVIQSQSGPPVESKAGLNKPVEAVPEVKKASSTDPGPVPDRTSKPQPSAADNSSVSHTGEGDVKSPSQLRGRLPKVKPKPILLQTSRIARSKRQTTEGVAEKESIESQNTSTKMPAELPDERTTSEETTSPKSLNQAAPDQSATEALISAKVVPELCVEQTSKDSEATSETVSTEQTDPELPAPHGSHLGSEGKEDSAAVAEATSNQDEKKMGSSQSRKGRLQKVKPKPNIPQLLRGARSKAQKTEDAVQKNPELPKNPSVEAEPQTKLTQELSANKEMKTKDGVKDQEELGGAQSGQSPTKTQNLSIQSSLEQATGDAASIPDLTKESAASRVEDPVLKACEVTEPELEQGLHLDFIESVNSASLNKSVEELAVMQKEEKSLPTGQTKRDRLSKIKPNLQTSRAARSTPQTTEEATQKYLFPGEGPDFRKKVEPEQELDLSVNEDTRREAGFVDPNVSTDQSTKESPNPCEDQPEPCKEQTMRDKGATSDSAPENLSYCFGLQSNVEPGKSGKSSAAAEKLTSGPEEEPSASDERKKGQIQKRKPKPNLVQTSRVLRSKFSKDSQDKNSSSIIEPKVPEDAMSLVEATLSLDSQPETVPSSTVQPIMTLESTSTPLTDSSSNEEQRELTELDSIDMIAEISDQSTTENQNFPEVQIGITRVEESPTEFSDKNLKSHVEPTDSRVPEAPKLGLDPTSSVAGPPAVKQGSEVASSCLSVRNRLSKIKPKPNLTKTSRPARLRPQISKESAQSSESCKKFEPENSRISNSASGSEQSKTVFPTEEKHPGHVDQADTDAATTGCSAPKKQNICQVLLEEQTSADQESASKMREEASPVGKSPDVWHLSAQACSEEAESNAKFRRLQKIRPKPNLPNKSRTARIGTPTINYPKEKDLSETQFEQDLIEQTSAEKAAGNQNISEVPNEDQTTGKIEEISSFVEVRNLACEEAEEGEVSFVGQELHLAASGTKQHVGEEAEAASTSQSKRRRFQKPKPNLPVTSKGAKSKPEVPKETVQLTVAMKQPQISTSKSMEQPQISISKSVEQPQISISKSVEQPQISISKSSDRSTSNEDGQFVLTSHKIKSSVAEPFVELSPSHKFVKESTSECKTNVEQVSNSEQNLLQRRPRLSRVRPKPNLESSRRASRRKVQPGDGSKPSGETSTPPSGLKTSVEMEPGGEKMDSEGPAQRDLIDSSAAVDAKVSTQVGSTSTSEARSVSAEGHSSTQSIDSAESEAADSSETSNKAPQPPNITCSSLAQRRQTDADSDTSSRTTDDVFNQKAGLEPRPGSRWPVGGDIDETRDKSSCLDPASQEVSSTQNTSALNPEGIHTYPLLMEMLPEQVPSDPDEPFFVLSLMEIPGEAVTSAAEKPPHHPVADAVTLRTWDSGESSTAAPGEKSVSGVSTKSTETSSASEEKPAESLDTFVARETDAAAENKAAISTRRRRTKAEATVSQRSDAEAAYDPRSCTKGKSLKKSDSSLGSKKSNRSGHQTRKAKDVSHEAKTSPSDSPAAKRKTSAKKAASASQEDAAPTKVRSAPVGSQSRPTAEHTPGTSTPSSTLRTARESCAEISSAEEEPTSVSQYFISDIFTEVDES
uniref:Transcription factor TFIIIB component B'' Myb domain-containing protein n=2 Tax=Oryzias latipes TaxID=8090 RepID=A0A3P9M6M3_ORYLA